MNKTYILHQETSPSAMSQAVAPIARVWQSTQNGIARLLGFKDSGNLSGAVTGLWLAALIAASIATPLAPVLAPIWGSITIAWLVWLIENKVTNTLTKSDQKKIKEIIL